MQAAPPTETNVFCLAYTHVFYASFSVGSSAAESMSSVFNLGWMENDVNPTFSQIYSAFVLSIAISLSNRESSCLLIAEWALE